MTRNQIIEQITLKVGEHETLSNQALKFWSRSKDSNPKQALKRAVDSAVILGRLARVSAEIVNLANRLRNTENDQRRRSRMRSVRRRGRLSGGKREHL